MIQSVLVFPLNTIPKKKKKERTKSNLYKPYLFFLFYSLLPCQILLIFIDLCPAAILFTNAIRPSTH